MPPLPLFPLDLVLFPGAPLPLHIFEPRYRQMLADCLEADSPFGIVTVTAEGHAPLPGAIGCTAKIRANQMLPDGRSNIVVTGERRFRLLSYIDSNLPYRVGSVEEFGDIPSTPPPADALAALQRLAQRLLGAMRKLHDAEGDPAEWYEDSEMFSFQVCGLLELPAPVQLQLLSLRSTAERVRQLLVLTPELVRQIAERADVHELARSNGRGRHPPEMSER
jgi:Lon protease-like protein